MTIKEAMDHKTKRTPTISERFENAFDQVKEVEETVSEMTERGTSVRVGRIEQLEQAYNVLATLNDRILRATELVTNKLQQLHAEQKLAEDFHAKCIQEKDNVQTVDSAIGAILKNRTEEDQAIVEDLAQRLAPNVSKTDPEPVRTEGVKPVTSQ